MTMSKLSVLLPPKGLHLLHQLDSHLLPEFDSLPQMVLAASAQLAPALADRDTTNRLVLSSPLNYPNRGEQDWKETMQEMVL